MPATFTGFFIASLLKGSPNSWFRITSINVVIPFCCSSHEILIAFVNSSGVWTKTPFDPHMAINKSPLNLASSLPKRTDNPKAVSSADEPGLRDYGIGAQILADLGLNKIKIITNDERRIIALEGYGLELTGRMFVDTEKSVPVKRDGVELKSSLLDRQQFNVEK